MNADGLALKFDLPHNVTNTALLHFGISENAGKVLIDDKADLLSFIDPFPGDIFRRKRLYAAG
jgi:hypothetical protein